MNVTCTGCPAKYSVPDEKVRGKRVRITCKHCGTQIVIDGHALGTNPSLSPGAARSTSKAPSPQGIATARAPTVKPPPEQAAAAAAIATVTTPESSWLVGYTDERQEQHTSSGLVELYASGKLGDALVWKDGMTHWASPFDVPELSALLGYQSVPARPRTYSAAPNPADDDPTVIGRSMFSDAASASSGAENSRLDAGLTSALAASRERKVEVEGTSAAVTGAYHEPKTQIFQTRQPNPELTVPARQASPELEASTVSARQSNPEFKPTTRPVRQSSHDLKPGTLAALQFNADQKAAALRLPQASLEFKPAAEPNAEFMAGTLSARHFSSDANAEIDAGFSSPQRSVAEPAKVDSAVMAKPVAARRAEKQTAGVDLFGGSSSADGDMESPQNYHAAEPVPKLTGARNESSVLFSLDALTKPAPKADRSTAHQKEREQQATDAFFDDQASAELMNMGGAGLGAMAAPDFTKPVGSAPESARQNAALAPDDAPPTKKGSGAMLGLIIGLIVVSAAAALAFVFIRKPLPSQQVESAAEPSTIVPNATSGVATDTARPSALPEVPSAASAASASAVTPSTSSSVAPAAPSSATLATPSSTSQAALAKPSATSGPKAPSAAMESSAKADGAKPESPSAAEPPVLADFDKGAALAALNAAAASAASCKKPDGTPGTGKASVTFSPTGRATNSTVTGAFAGTEVGGCVARAFRSAKVPPFSGDPVTVSKSFSIE